MSSERRILEKIVGNALSGKRAHVAAKNLFAGPGWKAAGGWPPRGFGAAPQQLGREKANGYNAARGD